MEFFKYTREFLNGLSFTSSTYTELDNFLSGTVKNRLLNNQSYIDIFASAEELASLGDEIEATYDDMLGVIKPQYVEVLRLTSQTKFESKNTTKSEYGDVTTTGSYYEPVKSGTQAQVNTNGQLSENDDDTTTVDGEVYRTLDDKAVTEFFNNKKELVESYFDKFINIYAVDDFCCAEGEMLTPEQLEALNSGITASKVSQIQTNKESILSLGGRMTNAESDIGLLGQAIVDHQHFIENLTNQNLLINGDFRVNQRGQASYASTTSRFYTLDRWKFSYNRAGITLTPNDLGITLSGQADSDNAWLLQQRLEDYKFLRGKTVTLSAKISGNTVANSARILINDGSSAYSDTIQNGVVSVSKTISSEATAIDVFIATRTTASVTFTVEWIKLELGSIATPFSPRPYAEELAICQRYYQIRTNSYTIQPSALDRPIPMRVDGTIGTTTISGVSYNTVDAEIY